MKKLLLVLFLFVFRDGFAQEYKSLIKEQWSTFINLTNNRQYFESTEYMMEEAFAGISKEQLASILLNDPRHKEFAISLDSLKFISIGNRKKIQGEEYVKVEYSYVLNMRPKDEKYTPEYLKENFAEAGFNYNKESGCIELFKEEKAIARTKNGSNWTFIIVNPAQKERLKEFIPAELLK